MDSASAGIQTALYGEELRIKKRDIPLFRLLGKGHRLTNKLRIFYCVHRRMSNVFWFFIILYKILFFAAPLSCRKTIMHKSTTKTHLWGPFRRIRNYFLHFSPWILHLPFFSLFYGPRRAFPPGDRSLFLSFFHENVFSTRTKHQKTHRSLRPAAPRSVYI